MGPRRILRAGKTPSASVAEKNRSGGSAGKVELITGIDGVSSRPVRKIVLRAE
jgi:hypothetical protein